MRERHLGSGVVGGWYNARHSNRWGATSMGSPLVCKQVVRFGGFELDLEAEQVRKAGVLTRLQPQPFKVLAMLVRRAGQIVTREELRHELWGDETFVDFEQGLNYCIRQIRVVLHDEAQTPRFIETIPRHGYRFIVPTEVLSSAARPAEIAIANNGTLAVERGRSLQVANAPWHRWVIAGATLLIIAMAVAKWLFVSPRAHTLNETDTVLLADFTNTTGDPLFDQTLKQGLMVQVEQSPFLSLVPEQRIRQTLKLIGQAEDAPLTPDTARQVCLRTGSAVILAGSLDSLGSHYVIGLSAINCRTGDSLDQEQVEASRKEDVLRALGKASEKLRQKLGESLSSIQKFDTPIEQATTASLEALHAYGIGRVSMRNGDFPSAVPYLKRAIELDPKFAMAYAALGTSYNNSGETTLAAPNIRRAYQLREQVSAREKFYIESRYLHFLTGELQQARVVYELWHQDYPRDPTPLTDLSIIYDDLGQYEKSLDSDRETLRLEPESGESYANLAYSYLYLGRLQEAQTTADRALAKNFDSPHLRIFLYSLAFMLNDETSMARQAAWCEGRPSIDHFMLHFQSKTAFYHGNLVKTRELSRRAVALAQQAKDDEEAAEYLGEEAMWEALVGNTLKAGQRARSALEISKAMGVKIEAALALAFAGDVHLGQTLSDELAKSYPEDTLVQLYYLPTIRAQLALDRHDSSKAVEFLQATSPYQSGVVAFPFYFIYVRGEAYLAAHRGKEAVAEFQRIIDHPSITLEDPIGALARIEIARAYVLEGDTQKARSAYNNFLTLWKDASPDLPILKQARAEYVKLK
jgi:DNA-binding winged helix-turn-helix (wHTH) protein/tetratricopeptide (TPR) repeat protein